MSALLETKFTHAVPVNGAIGATAAAFAAQMQNTLVPPLLYRGDCIEAQGQCLPKDEIGGDLMDLIADGSEVIAYVADVSGHGLRAGVLMGMIKTAMRYGLLLRRPLKSLVSDLNSLLPQVKEPGMFATLAALRFDESDRVEYVSAGHVPLLQYRKRTNEVVRHYAQQIPLGLFGGGACASQHIPFEPGDIFALLTDGVVESGEERDGEAGLELLGRSLRKSHDLPLSDILDLCNESISGEEQHDDRTLLLVRTLGGSGDHAELSRWSPLNYNRVDLLEARWRGMLAELAAGIADE